MIENLPAAIRDRRHELGLTQAQLAELVGRSPSTIGAWETGRSRPADEATEEALARVLDLDAIDTAERVPAPPARLTQEPDPATPAESVPPVQTVPPAEAQPEPTRPTDADERLQATPVRTDTDPLYRVRLVATVAAIVVLGWVFAASIGAAGEILASVTETMLAPFRG